MTVTVLVGLVLLVVGGELADRLGLGTGWSAALAAPGAVLVTVDVGVDLRQAWAAPVGGALLAGVAPFAIEVDRRYAASGVGPCLLAASAGGVYACVPETDHVVPILGALCLLAAATVLLRLPMGGGGMLVGLGLLVWASLFGGTYRDSALIGAFAAIALVAAEPLGRRLAAVHHGDPWVSRRSIGPVLVVVHAAACLLVTRTAGLQPTLGRAVALALPVLVGSVLVADRLFGRVRAPRRLVLPVEVW